MIVFEKSPDLSRAIRVAMANIPTDCLEDKHEFEDHYGPEPHKEPDGQLYHPETPFPFQVISRTTYKYPFKVCKHCHFRTYSK